MIVPRYDSPAGPLGIQLEDGVVTRIFFLKNKDLKNKNTAVLPPDIRHQFDGYFSGSLKKFTVKISMDTTPFRKKIYEEMKKIPYGKTVSYKQLAGAAGSPGAYRAAASACAANPLPLIIPCHRVIGSDGTLHGYAGGLQWKKFLLDHEIRNK